MVTPDLIEDCDAWYEKFRAIPHDEQFQFIEETLEHSVSEEFLSECGMAELLSERKSSVTPERYAQVVEKLRQVGPAFHRRELFYLEKHVVPLALFRADADRLAKSVAYYVENPERDVDKYLQVYRWCMLYQQAASAKIMAEAGILPFRSDPGVMPGAEDALENFLILAEYEAIYDRVRQGTPLDLQPVVQVARRLNGDTIQDLEEISCPLFADDVGPRPDIAWTDDSERGAMLRKFYWHFLGYTHDRYQLSFSVADLIWENYAGCLGSRTENLDGAQYFIPTVADVNNFLDRYRVIFFYWGEIIAATIWGLQYIADCLHDAQWIGNEERQALIEVANTLKASVIEEDGPVLWHYDFVHRWEPPASESSSHFAEEAQLFADSVHLIPGQSQSHHISPLGNLFPNMFRGFARDLGLSGETLDVPQASGRPPVVNKHSSKSSRSSNSRSQGKSPKSVQKKARRRQRK